MVPAFTRYLYTREGGPNAKQSFSHFQAPQDLTGKEALEIGTWDGPIAFEAEARGTMLQP